jgi:hypothetical protein
MKMLEIYDNGKIAFTPEYLKLHKYSKVWVLSPAIKVLQTMLEDILTGRWNAYPSREVNPINTRLS